MDDEYYWNDLDSMSREQLKRMVMETWKEVRMIAEELALTDHLFHEACTMMAGDIPEDAIECGIFDEEYYEEIRRQKLIGQIRKPGMN